MDDHQRDALQSANRAIWGRQRAIVSMSQVLHHAFNAINEMNHLHDDLPRSFRLAFAGQLGELASELESMRARLMHEDPSEMREAAEAWRDVVLPR